MAHSRLRLPDDHPIALCLAGRISPPVMLARLALTGHSDAEIERILATLPRAATLRRFFQAHRALLPRLRQMVAVDHSMDHRAGGGPATIAAQFDAAVAIAPEASVAAYSLGEPRLLAAATEEVVRWLQRERLYLPGMDVLDLGCGIGRIAAALAPSAASVLGLDVAPGMIREAQHRYAAMPRLHFAVTPGTGLAALPDGGFDLVLAVDSFPYLLLAGGEIARRHVADIARVLRLGGRFVVLNLSYGNDPGADAARLTDWAAGDGLHPLLADAAPFSLWDARAFVFGRYGNPDLTARFDPFWQRSEDSC